VFIKKFAAIFLCVLTFSTYAANRAEIAWDMIGQGALLVDVRTPQEFDAQHLDNAINYPLNTVATAFSHIKKDRQIVVYCRSGNRSGQALRYLRQVGFSRIHNGGGLNELLAEKK